MAITKYIRMTGRSAAANERIFFGSVKNLVVFSQLSRTVHKKNEKSSESVTKNVEKVLACHNVNPTLHI